MQLNFNHQRRFGPEFRHARELLRSGAIGDLARLEGSCGNIFDWGTHWFDMFFFYNDERTVDWVLGQVEPSGGRSIFGIQVEGQAISQFQFENGVIGILSTNLAEGWPLSTRIVGTDGFIEAALQTDPLRIWAKGTSKWETVALEGKNSLEATVALGHGCGRLFLWVILLFALLSVAIGYPAEFTGSVQTVSLLGTEIDLAKMPIAALLSATWVLTFAITLRYCQTSILIDRQYRYIHALEQHISPMVAGGDLYQREGEVYLRGYPLLFNVAYYAYVIIFPIILILASLSLWVWERNQLPTHWLHKTFDLVLVIAIIGSLFLYRMQPYLSEKVRHHWGRIRSTRGAST